MNLLLLLVTVAATAALEGNWTNLQPHSMFSDRSSRPRYSDPQTIVQDGGDWIDLDTLPFSRPAVDICDPEGVTDTFGTIISPNHPQKYPANSDCSLTLEAPPGGSITLTCTSFWTQGCRRRTNDYLKITTNNQLQVSEGNNELDLEDDEYIMCGRYGKRKLPTEVFTSGDRLILEFVSNRRRQFSGFSCDYLIQGDVSADSDNSSCPCDNSGSDGSGSSSGINVWNGPCGVPSASSRIMRGLKVDIEQYPWMVALEVCDRPDFCWECSGTIIGALWIVTGASCIGYGSSVRVLLGSTEANVLIADTMESSQIITHSDFTAKCGSNDISLIQLPRALTFTDKIRPVCLPSPGSEVFSGQIGHISGWGSYLSPYSRPLTHANVSIVSNSKCKASWDLPDDMICGKVVGDGTACGGDWGGPLQIRRSNNTYVLMGILNYFPESCEMSEPLLFTSLISHVEYIENKMDEYS